VLPVLEQLNLRDPESVIAALIAGAKANRESACRRGSIDVIGPFANVDESARLIATGDLHDNPLHFARVVQAANLADIGTPGPRFHLTLHELIHSDNIVNHTDFSYRVLARAAALKAAFPTLVHTLLANHELSQMSGTEVVKEGVRCVAAFNTGLESVFGERWREVASCVSDFILSMPIGLRVNIPPERGPADVLCFHSLPAPELMDRFDRGVLDRPLGAADYEPRRGSAHLLVWGRGQNADQLADLARCWGAGLFVLGHEHAEDGVMLAPPNCLILNSDHAKGRYLSLDLRRPCGMASAAATSVPLVSAQH
jgi:hypothetical protein